MPLRYLVVIAWSDGAVDDRLPRIAERAGMGMTARAGPIALMANGPEDILALPEARGFVVGKLFHRHGYPRQVEALPADAAVRILSSGGRHLVERYWGSYVAVLAGTDGGIAVLRDPSGGLPCYHCAFDGGTAFTSDAAILYDAGLLRPSVDWNRVGEVLYRHHLPLERTALAGMSQILAGCGLSLRGGTASSRQLWSPWDHVAPRPPGGEPASVRLERVVSTVASAWGSCFAKPIVGLSGGLDSSIVAVALARSGADLGAVTLTTDDPRGDESAYARAVCEQIGAPLIALPFREDAIDLDISVAADVPVPCGKLHEQAYNAAVRQAATQWGADAFFVGAGGDNIFYATHSARPLVDRYEAEGLSPGIWATLRDIAAITGASLWQVAREARRLWRMRQAAIDWTCLPDYLAPDLVEFLQSGPGRHPWLVPDRRVPMGKLGQVKLLLRAMNHLEHRDKDLSAAMISPLLSQPVVELCLGIPSWEAVEGGVDRAVARDAFAATLPPTIAQRRGKGSPEGFVARFIETRRDAIADRLGQGLLARHGILDIKRLVEMLGRRGKLGPRDCARLMSLLDTEAWVHRWSDRPARAGEG